MKGPGPLGVTSPATTSPASTTRVIVYRSRATGTVSDTDLYYLLAHAQERNEIAEVSGLLIYDRGCFFQWIEGAEQPLLEIWTSIRQDARHQEIKLLADQEITARRFHGWSMRFAHRDVQHATVVRGFIRIGADFADRLHLDARSAPRLMASFGRTAR